MSWVLLLHHSFCFPMHSSGQRLDALCQPTTDDLCLGGVHTCQLVLELDAPGWSSDHGVIAMRHP